MTVLRFIGDVHGKYKQYEKLISECSHSVQVGDMGIGFFKFRGSEVVKMKNPSFDKMMKGSHRFIRGNHDNPQHCLNHPCCISDGAFEVISGKKIYYLGGAVSIDKVYRTEGMDWWPDEELSAERLKIEVDLYKEIQPDIVVTHDCPESIARQMMDILNIYDKEKYPSRTRQALESMFYFHKPKLWIFGHWHKDVRFNQVGTDFQCLGELSYRDVDLLVDI